MSLLSCFISMYCVNVVISEEISTTKVCCQIKKMDHYHRAVMCNIECL